MCGIIGYTGKNKAVPYLLSGLSRLEYRGYDSSGIALCEENGISIIKAEGRLGNLKAKLTEKCSSGHCGIGHTRWATHGVPSDENAHPHKSSSGTFTVVHNGIIENYLSLKKELISEGFTFLSDTDTEVVANLLEKLYEDDPFAALRKCTDLLEGSYALAVLCKDFPDRIFAVKKGSPLIAAKSENGTFIASDITALLHYTDEVFTLKENEALIATESTLAFFGSDGKEIKKKSEKVTWSAEEAEKGGYEHFMLKEIHEQPTVLRETLSSFTEKDELFPELKDFKKEMKNIDKIYFIGCGSAYHVGVAGKILTEKLCALPCSCEIASEFRYGSSPADERTLCIFISQSGETADTLAALTKAKEQGAKIISIVNVVGSSIARESDNVLYTKAGPEIAVATTKAYSAQTVTVYLLAVCLAEIRGKITKAEKDKLLKEIFALPDKVSTVINDLKDKIIGAAEIFSRHGNGYFIGRGGDYGAAVEGSLKMKEISYIHTEAYPSGELKHGTISLLEKETPVVALCCHDSLFKKTLSNIKEVKARGARVLIITKEKFRKELTDEEHILLLPDTDELFSSLVEVTALQLLSYYTALSRGCDIDKPRNLAKSVTVE